MKKIKFIKVTIFAIVISLILPLVSVVTINAASFTASSNAKEIKPGGTFTVSISGNVTGRFNIAVSNGSAPSSIWVEGSGSFSVVAGSSGTTSVTVIAADVTDSNYQPVTGSKSMSVKIIKNNGGSSNNGGSNNSGGSNSQGGGTNNANNKPQTNTDEKSTNNNLSSLSISKGSLNPKFDAATTSYNVVLTEDVKTVKIDAKAENNKATITGIGDKNIKAGDNNFDVIVKAENGSEKKYTLHVFVEKSPTTFLEYKEEKLGILEDVKDIKVPDGFNEVKIKLDDKEIKGYESDILKIKILYMVNEKGERGFYIFENNGIISKFTPIALLGNNYIMLEIPEDLKNRDLMSYKDEIEVDIYKMPGWEYDDSQLSNYKIVYLMNDKGEKNYYQYEKSMNTLQIFDGTYPIMLDAYKNELKSKQNWIYGAYAAIVAAVILLIGCIVIFILKNKKIKAMKL